MKRILLLLLLIAGKASLAQTQNTHTPADDVNVFLGSSGDYGQMSPAASAPFSYLSICPQTYPHGHTGYEYLAKKVNGFTHNRFEGVGCKGSGGILLVKPFTGDNPMTYELTKKSEAASPGYYAIDFTNGLKASFAVNGYNGVHQYEFPASKSNKKLWIDLAHAANNGFVSEEHQQNTQTITGWIKAKTTCGVGDYIVYYSVKFDQDVQIESAGEHHLMVSLKADNKNTLTMRVSFSSTSVDDAIKNTANITFAQLKQNSKAAWNKELSHIQVSGDPARRKLFYSLLYRAIQSPYIVSEKDGRYQAINGTLQHSNGQVYHGWSIWDNYKTQLPLLSLAWQDRYQDVVSSIANLYRYGKRDYATRHEPSNSVRTEHAIVVLLDAEQKGYRLNFSSIADSVKKEVDSIKSVSPDKNLETAYDFWAYAKLSQLNKRESDYDQYLAKSKKLYQNTWQSDFKNMNKSDVDRLPARGMYQGTVWQYRWLVPYDVKGLINLSGGEKPFLNDLDTFFEKDLYSHANEHDIQVPSLYNATADAWKSQHLMHRIGLDTMVQYYFNTNERDIGATIDRIYKNKPEALLRTMDDDAGAMSGWFVLAACGVFPAAVGVPVYYLNVPYFPSVNILVANGNHLTITVKNFTLNNCYIKKVLLNGKDIKRTWLTHDELKNGGKLEITASGTPETYGNNNLFITDMMK